MLMAIFIVGVLIIPDEFLAIYAILFIIYMISSLVFNTFKKRKISLYEKNTRVSKKIIDSEERIGERIEEDKKYYVYLSKKEDSIFSYYFTYCIAESHRNFQISKELFDILSKDYINTKYSIDDITKLKDIHQLKKD